MNAKTIFRLNFTATFLVSIAPLVLMACAALQQHSAAVQLIVSQATMRYVESTAIPGRVERAARVISVAKQIEQVASAEPVTIAQLAQLALAAIPSNLEPSDRALATSIVQIAAQELSNKVGEGVLSADKLVTVKEIVQAIRGAAEIYTGGS